MTNVREAREPHLRTLLRWTGRLLALAFAALVIGALAVLVVIPRAVHGQAMTVLTGSMTPTIPVGSTVLVRPVDPATLHVGDIATYQKTAGKAVYITHRIVKIDTRTTPARFTFKGDANRGPDLDLVSAQQVRGQVWFHVPYLGAIRDALHGKGGPTLLVALLLAGYALSQIGSGLRERRAESSPPDVRVKVNRPVVAATLDVAELRTSHDLTPEEVAASWSAVVVHADHATCTLLIAPPPGGLASCLELLEQFGMSEAVVIEQPGVLTGRGTRTAPPVKDGDRVEV